MRGFRQRRGEVHRYCVTPVEPCSSFDSAFAPLTRSRELAVGSPPSPDPLEFADVVGAHRLRCRSSLDCRSIAGGTLSASVRLLVRCARDSSVRLASSTLVQSPVQRDHDRWLQESPVARDLAYSEALGRRELCQLQQTLLNLTRSLLVQASRVGAMASSVRVAWVGSNERPRIPVLVHVMEYAAGVRAAINRDLRDIHCRKTALPV